MITSTSSDMVSPYYLFGGVRDDEASDLLGALNSRYKVLQPAIGSTPIGGADWVNISLTANEVASLSPNADVLLLAPYLSLTESASVTGNEVSTTASFTTLSSYPSTTLSTLSASSAFSESSSPSAFDSVWREGREWRTFQLMWSQSAVIFNVMLIVVAMTYSNLYARFSVNCALAQVPVYSAAMYFIFDVVLQELPMAIAILRGIGSE